MTKILIIGDSDIFVKRFVEYFSSKGYEVCLLTFGPMKEEIDVKVIVMPYKRPFGGLLNFSFARRIVRSFRPDLLHIFSGGVDAFLGTLLNVRPCILNVYGTDVFDVPRKSFMHKFLIRRNLLFYDQICSTSEMMAIQTMSLISDKKSVIVTPFGVDLKEFENWNSVKKNENTIVIGTVKRLTKKYGIDTLIRATYLVKSYLLLNAEVNVKLIIVGDGADRESLENLAIDLGLSDNIEFIGYVPNKFVKNYLNQMDIFAALSRLESESFGVAVVEASAMGLPVVCSNIGGLPEVVKDGVTGFLVEVDNVDSAANRILELVLNEKLRIDFGKNGRDFIQEKYSFETNADILIDLHQKLLRIK